MSPRDGSQPDLSLSEKTLDLEYEASLILMDLDWSRIVDEFLK